MTNLTTQRTTSTQAANADLGDVSGDESEARRLTQAERSDRSDTAMLASAVSLIVERGPAATTLKDVGEHAGFSRGLAGHRFGSKDGLFEFVLRSVGEAWLSRLTEATAGLVGRKAIARALDEHCQCCVQAPDNFIAFYRLWFEAVGEQSQAGDVVRGIHSRRRRDVARWIAAGKQVGDVADEVDSAAVASQFTASVVGIVYTWLQSPNDLDEVEGLHANLMKTMDSLLIKPGEKPLGDRS